MDTPLLADDPIIPVRDLVIFPRMVLPLFIARPTSARAVGAAMEGDHMVVLVSQRDPAKEDPAPEDLYEVGTMARLAQVVHLRDGTIKVLAEAQHRVRLTHCHNDGDMLRCRALPLPSTDGAGPEVEALRRTVVTAYLKYAKSAKEISKDTVQQVRDMDSADMLADAVAMQLVRDAATKQALLAEPSVEKRLSRLLPILMAEGDIAAIEKRIQGRVKQQMDKNQRKYFLHEQMKAIQKELGGEEMAEDDDFGDYRKRIEEVGLSPEAKAKATSELRKLRQMQPMSAEATVVRGYLDVLLDLPWKKKTRVSTSIRKAAQILDADHWGLEKVKERILEYLAVQRRVDKVKSPILCLVGGPGVGKTSLGESIARATGRKFVRMALGGVYDESEIRGHRRTYIGSMPGKIIQSISKAGTRNPLFLLDEIDKLGRDFRGDPAAALLEVLDLEQNRTFQDNYLDVDFDLSDVMFVATSNGNSIPPPLLDRMEVIHLSGYTEDEKMHIARRHLIPKQMKLNGVRADEARISDSALRDIIRYYTREAGVRGLERSISKILRKVVLRHSAPARGAARPTASVTARNLSDYLGARKFSFGVSGQSPRVGQVNGLAWTEAGGDLLAVEAAVFPGKGVVQRTGSLGEVMKESVEAARSVVRSRAAELGIDPAVFPKTDWHLHFPEGAIPKDGPSAGAAICLAIVSAMTGIPVRSDLALTGEITLRGEILEIGGLKEKLLAALRGGIREVLIPRDNVKDLAEIPDNVKSALEITPVRHIDEVLRRGLTRAPRPLDAPAELLDPGVLRPARTEPEATLTH